MFSDGVYTVLITPFLSDDTIDYESLENIAKIQVANTNITGLVILGTTSEQPTLTMSMKKAVINCVYNICNKKKDLIIGIGGNCTRDVIEFLHYANTFADGLMVTVPAYNKPPQAGIVKHFCEIAKHTEKPILMYNIPSRTGTNMTPETMYEIVSKCKNIKGVKEASGNMEQVKKINDLFLKNKEFKIFSGDDMNIIDMCKLGAKGVISVASNICPDIVNSILVNSLNKEYIVAKKLANKARPFFESLFITSNPIPIKELLYKEKIIKTNHVLLPLVVIENDIIKNIIYSEYKKLIN